MPPKLALSKSPDFMSSVLQSLAQSNPDLAARAAEAVRTMPRTQKSDTSAPVVPRQRTSEYRAGVKENHHRFDQIEPDSTTRRMSQREIEREMQYERAVPTKRSTKKRGKMTKGTQSWFNAVALKGVPGASNAKGYAAIAQMYEEGTGCLVIDDLSDNASALRRRLENSAKHCDTTKGNYILSYVHPNKVEETEES